MKRWKLLVLHPMEDHKKVFSIQILIIVKVKVVKPHFEFNMKARTMHIINMKVNIMEVYEETLEEEEITVEIIEVNN